MAEATPFFGLWGIDAAAQQKALAIMTELVMMAEDKLADLDNVSMREFISRYDIPFELYSYMAMHANVMIRAFEKNGGALVRNTKVDTIVVEVARLVGHYLNKRLKAQ